MTNVELIYDADCPNVAAARSLLIKAFAQTGVSARWREWERSAPDSPEYARRYGSPTILVNERDVGGGVPGEENAACRIYGGGDGGLSGTPPREAICAALQEEATGKPARTRWQAVAASLPAVGAAFLPKLTCPLCFPAYAALLSALGLEFIDYTPYLLPLTAAFLVAVAVMLALQSRRTGAYSPLILGIAASVLVLLGKFHLESDWAMIGGIALLVAAVIVGGRMKSASPVSCPACATGGSGQQLPAR